MVNVDDDKFKKLKKADKEEKLDKIMAKIDEKIADNQFYITTLTDRKAKTQAIKDSL